jgi:hypothetical protein
VKLYKFYKEDCSPCSTLKKILKLINLEDYELIEINMSLQENKDKFSDIDVVPVLQLENGKKLIGVKTKSTTEKWLKENSL